MIRALFRDTIIYGLAAILSRGLSILILPIYTRILAPAEYGVLDMIFVVMMFANLIVALEITQALARFYHEAQGDAARSRMASTALWFTLGAYAIVTCAAFAAARPLSAWLLGDENMVTAMRIGLATIAANGLFYLAQNQLRFALRSAAYAVLSLTYSVALVGLGILFGYGFGWGLIGVLWGQLAGTCLAALLGLWLLRSSYDFRFDQAMLRSMLAFSLPLVPAGLATFVTLYANRLLLNEVEGLDAVGLFGVAARIAGAIALLIVGLQAALTPLIYAHHEEPETPAQLARLTEQFTAFALAACLGLGLFAWEILALFAEPRYIGGAPLVLLLAPATLLGQMYIFFPGIAISKRTRLQLYIFAATAAATIAFNWILIETAGLIGAAFATLAASLLFILLWARTSQRIYPLPIRWRPIAAGGLLFALAGAGGLWIQAMTPSEPLSLAARSALLALFLGGTAAAGLMRPSDFVRLGRQMLARRTV
jgi:O-antigen/teichoic acid export membrane protein